MKKIMVVYWSGTGNTQQMAEAVAEGAGVDGISVSVIPVGEAVKADILKADALAFGCPAMGDEVLEEEEMESFIKSLEGEDLAGIPLVLFGSYDWGDGQWMRDWGQRMKAQGAQLLAEGLIVQNAPEQSGLDQCKSMGGKLAEAVTLG